MVMITLENELKQVTLDLMRTSVARFDNLDMDGGIPAPKNHSEYEFLEATIRAVKSEAKDVTRARSDLTTPFETAKKAIIAKFSEYEKFVSFIDQSGKQAMGRYVDAKLQESAKKQALLDERARKERELLELRAEKHAAAGRMEKAEALGNQAAVTVAAPVEVVKAKGGRRVPGVTLRDKKEFLQAAILTPLYMSCVEVNMTKVKALAKQLGESEEENVMPGVDVVWRTDFTIR